MTENRRQNKKDILSAIVEYKKKEVEVAKKKFPLSLTDIKPPFPIRDFKSAIKKDSKKIKLIAEVKKASPSAGIIREDFEPQNLAKQYEKAGASAISVLTDKKFFQGDLSYIKLIKENVKLPILRKDFMIDEYQIYESVISGADAILLISEILSLSQLKNYIKIASDCKLDCLVESYTKNSVQKSLKAEAEIVGINNRDLKSFEVNLGITKKLIEDISKDKIIVSESGVKTHKDVLYLENLGVDAVLIGETFMKAKNIKTQVKKVMGW